MVRFKVIKGSHLLLGFAALMLAIVIGALVIRFAISPGVNPASANASLVSSGKKMSEAETQPVFASLGLITAAIPLDPEQDGNLMIEMLPHSDPVAQPRILIYHTHTHEAYEQVDNDRYEAIEAWRTHDQDHSVVRVGQELANLLRSRGFDVTHDTTDHEQNELGTAYTRSLKTLESYAESFDLYIDLHRDAYIKGAKYDQITLDGQPIAQLMMLIGNGVGFETKPFYAENLAFAESLTERINDRVPNLCKDVLVKDGRYNQHVGMFSILVEVGHNRNTLKEALNALPPLADAIESLLIDDPEPELLQFQNPEH